MKQLHLIISILILPGMLCEVISKYVEPGNNITLNCNCSNITTFTRMRWIHHRYDDFTNAIFYYNPRLPKGHTTHDWVGKIELVNQNLTEQDFSVTLSHLQQTDTGKFTCVVYSRKNISMTVTKFTKTFVLSIGDPIINPPLNKSQNSQQLFWLFILPVIVLIVGVIYYIVMKTKCQD